MTSQDGYWNGTPATFDLSRYLEYTNDSLRERLAKMTDAVIEELKTLPTLFAYEAYKTSAARVGWITGIQRRHAEVRLVYEFDESIPPIAHEQIIALARELDIEPRYEVHRPHWAVKEVDLLAVLRKAEIISNKIALTTDHRFSRQSIIKACDVLSQKLQHSDLNELLLEAGIEELKAGRELGGLKARSVAIATYAVNHIEERTIEGELFTFFLVKRAAQASAYYALDFENSPPAIAAFWASLKKDGVSFEDGTFFAARDIETPLRKPTTPPYLSASAAATVSVSIPQPPPDAPEGGYQCFISYAGEDRPLVKQLVNALVEKNIRVWWDKGQIRLGDKLTLKIDEGLASSKHGLIVVSRSFVAKQWPQAELRALAHRAVEGSSRAILPVLVGMDHDQFSRTYPLLADIVSTTYTGDIQALVSEIVDAIRL